MNLKQMLDKRSNGKAGSLLKGTNIPAGTKTIIIEVAGVRESPEGFGAPVLLDLKKSVYGKSAWAPNKTSLRKLMQQLGEDTENWVGKKIKLEVITARNPQTGEIVPSLAVSARQVA